MGIIFYGHRALEKNHVKNDEEDFVYLYVIDGDIQPITSEMINKEIENYLKKSDIPIFKELGQGKLKSRLFSFVRVLGLNSNYHPSTYLDGIDKDDIEAFKADLL